jgi:hypothetical protein
MLCPLPPAVPSPPPQLLAFAKKSTSGDLRAAVMEVLSVKASGSSTAADVADLESQLEAAMAAARPATAGDAVDGALSIGRLAGRLINVVVGVAALQLVKGVSGAVLQQVSIAFVDRLTAGQRLWVWVVAVVCWLSEWAHKHQGKSHSEQENASAWL